MSQQKPTPGDVRVAIKETVQRHRTITAAEAVAETAADLGCAQADVVEQLDELEDEGLVYLAGGGEQSEVRLP